jgi:hypothetical protein
MTIITQTPAQQTPVSSGTSFSPRELTAMNRYCRRFRDLVRDGETPTAQQEEKFMRYQRICYSEGAAHE